MRLLMALIISLIILFQSCATTGVAHIKTSGKYSHCFIKSNCNEISLNKNGSFQYYTSSYYSGPGTVLGSWQTSKDTLILNYNMPGNPADSLSLLLYQQPKKWLIQNKSIVPLISEDGNYVPQPRSALKFKKDE